MIIISLLMGNITPSMAGRGQNDTTVPKTTKYKKLSQDSSATYSSSNASSSNSQFDSSLQIKQKESIASKKFNNKESQPNREIHSQSRLSQKEILNLSTVFNNEYSRYDYSPEFRIHFKSILQTQNQSNLYERIMLNSIIEFLAGLTQKSDNQMLTQLNQWITPYHDMSLQEFFSNQQNDIKGFNVFQK